MTAGSGYGKKEFLMNKKPVLGAILVVLLVCGTVLIGCKDGGGGLSAPGARSAKDIPNYVGAIVTSEDQAKSLFSAGLTSMLVDIRAANSAAYATAFKEAYPVGALDISSYKAAQQLIKNSVSYSVKINDAVELAKVSPGAILEGSAKESANTNMTNLYTASSVYGTGLTAVGDTLSSSSSTKYTSTIKNLYTKSGRQLGGIVSY